MKLLDVSISLLQTGNKMCVNRKCLVFFKYFLKLNVSATQVTQNAEQSLAAVWCEKGQVEIFDLRPQLEAVHSSTAMAAFIKQNKEATPLFSFSGHMTEGFAIDWSPKVPGKCGVEVYCLIVFKKIKLIILYTLLMCCRTLPPKAGL